MNILLAKHNILTEIMNQVEKVVNNRHYREIEIDAMSINPTLLASGLTDSEIGQYLAHLVTEDFIYLFSKDDKKTMIIKIKQKGVSAASSEYFKEEYFRYKRELRMYKSAMMTNKSSRRNNLWSPLFAGLAALVTIIGLIREILKDKQQQMTIEQFQQQTKRQDSLLQIQQTQINSLSREMARLDSAGK